MPKGIYLRKPRMPKQYPAEQVEAVRRLYYDQGMSQVEVAQASGLGFHVVQRIMEHHGLPRRSQIKRDQRGEKNSSWKGERATYTAFHSRLYSWLGTPVRCDVCGTTDPSKTYDWANLTGRYADASDYQRMCRSCHHKYDGKHRNLGAYAVRKEASHTNESDLAL